MFYGVHDPGLRTPGQEDDVIFSHGILWLFTCCMRPCIVMLENARSVILKETTNYLLCMNPVKTTIMVAVENDYVGELTC